MKMTNSHGDVNKLITEVLFYIDARKTEDILTDTITQRAFDDGSS